MEKYIFSIVNLKWRTGLIFPYALKRFLGYFENYKVYKFLWIGKLSHQKTKTFVSNDTSKNQNQVFHLTMQFTDHCD